MGPNGIRQRDMRFDFCVRRRRRAEALRHHEEESGEEHVGRTGKGEVNAGLEGRSSLGAEIREQKRGVAGGLKVMGWCVAGVGTEMRLRMS